MKVTIDEHDRLIHSLLQEALGGDAPPDVTAGVLERTHPQGRLQTLGAPCGGASGKPPGALNSLHFRRPWLIPAATVAAVAVIAAGLWALHAHWNYPAPAASGECRVVGGGPVERGAVIATDDSNATVVLGGYCHVDISPQSRLRLQGAKLAEEIFLETGSAMCDVNRNVGTFAVRTEVGTVSVTGTKFTVRVLKDEGDSTMSGKQMVVRVLVGSVMLSGAWGSMALSAGEEKTVGHASGVNTGTTESVTLKGKIGSIDGAKIDMLTWPSGAKEPTHTAVTVNDSTTITLGGKAAKLADLKAGMYATATVGAGEVATTIAANAPGHSESTTKSSSNALTGKIGGISGNKIDFISWRDNKRTDVAITVNDGTAITLDGNAARLADVKAGLYATATMGEGGVATALDLKSAHNEGTTTKPATLHGTIDGISGNKIDVLTPHTGKESTHTTVITDNKTIVTIDGKAELVSDLKLKMYVHVTAGDGGVTTIDAYTPGQHK